MSPMSDIISRTVQGLKTPDERCNPKVVLRPDVKGRPSSATQDSTEIHLGSSKDPYGTLPPLRPASTRAVASFNTERPLGRRKGGWSLERYPTPLPQSQPTPLWSKWSRVDPHRLLTKEWTSHKFLSFFLLPESPRRHKRLSQYYGDF